MNAMKPFPSLLRMWREPGSLLFPLSGILACAAVVPWLVAAFTADGAYRNIYHMIAGVQAFLTCLIAAFCFVGLHDHARCRTAHEVKSVAVFFVSIGVCATAWLRHAVPRELMLGVSEICWLVGVVIIALTAFPRVSRAREEDLPESAFIFLTSALVFGIAGAALVSIYSLIGVATGNEIWWIVFLGRGYLLQCMVLTVVMAFSPVVLPKVFGSQPAESHRWSTGRSFPAACVLVLGLTIPLELWVSYRAGMLLRAVLTYLTIVHACGLLAFPRRSSPLSLYIWISAWMVPGGYLIAALAPEWRLVGLHAVFIGGFAMGLLSYALYWVIDEDDALIRRFDRAAPAGAFSGFLLISLVLRSLSEASEGAKAAGWGYATIAYTTGVLVWIYLIVTALRLRKTPALPHSRV